MKRSAEKFLNAPHKAVTFTGMSGVGKTYLSAALETWGWSRMSCDYEIGRKDLARHLARPMASPEDIGVLSDFIGRPGDPAKGGLPFDEFRRRQKLYYEAECAAVLSAAQAAGRASGSFVHDSTGSLCEITDEAILETLGRATLFVYLKAGAEEERAVLERAQTHPKPLFFPPGKLDEWVRAYLEESGEISPDTMDPDGFSRWVFPKLFAERLPKYQRLADVYGVTVESAALHGVEDEADFIARIAEALKSSLSCPTSEAKLSAVRETGT